MKRIILLVIISLFSFKINAQEQPEMVWQARFGGFGTERSFSFNQTKDGNFFIAGSSNSFSPMGFNDFFVIKISKNKEVKWQKTYGGSFTDELMSADETFDGGLILAGYTTSTDGDIAGCYKGNIDGFLVKVDSLGNKEWSKNIGGLGSDNLMEVKEITGGQLIIVGSTNSSDSLSLITNNGSGDLFLAKLDEKGRIIWQKTYGGKGNDFGLSVAETMDRGFIAVGSSDSYGMAGNYDYFVIKVNYAGELEWQKNFGGKNSDNAITVQQTSGGDYLIGGYVANGNSNNSSVIKVNSAGNLIWERKYPEIGNVGIESLELIEDGGFIAVGSVMDSLRSYNCLVLRCDSLGQTQWKKVYGGSGNDFASSVKNNGSGQYIIGGSTNTPIALANSKKVRSDYDFFVTKIVESQEDLTLNLGIGK